MKVVSHTLIAGRYTLVDRLGTGAMGEVWRARDTRFESRLVAVKLLREDETLKEDALNRDRMLIQLEQQASRGGISSAFAVEAIASALAASNIEGLKARAASAFATAEGISPTAVTTLFDEVVNDPAFNDNAKLRAKMRRLFRDEANTVANLRHDNVVSIFDYGDHEGNPFLVMDYIEGRTLYQILQAQEILGQSRRLQLVEDLCAGLGYAHRHKLVHRDIKPANLIIASTTGSLKILDFGVVRRIGSASTIGVPVGTFCYMSPEQTRGDATLDHRSDIFAVGLIFYELMSGRKAFAPGKSITDLVSRIQRDPPPPISELVPSISPAVEEIISKAIEKRPDDRYQDLAMMGRAIARIRAPLEAAEQSERTMIAVRANPTVMPVKPPVLLEKPPDVSIADLLASAERAFASGDDQAAVDFCSRILTQKPGFPPALSLLARAEARRWDSRLREVLQQAETQMASDELTSAKATLGRAREIDPSSPRIRAVEEKLEAALAARASARERAERARVEQSKALPAPPPPSPLAIDLDADAVTRPFVGGPFGRPPLPSMSKSPPASAPPAPPPPAPRVPVEAAPTDAIKPPSSVRRRRIVKPVSEDTGGPAPAPFVPPPAPPAAAAPPRVSVERPKPMPPPPVSVGVERPTPTPPPVDPAGEALLARPSGPRPSLQPAPAPAMRAEGLASGKSREAAPLAGEIPTRRVDRASIQRALSQDARSVKGAVRQARPRAWMLLWFAVVAVPLLAIATYFMIPGKPTAPADPAVTPVATPLPPPTSSPDPPAVSPRPAGGVAEREISRVVDVYIAALSTRDIDEVAKVRDFSASTRDGLQRAFQAVQLQRVTLVGVPRITVDGARARVEATMRYDVEQSTGERAQTDVSATLVLNRIRNEWRIVRVAP